MINRYSLAGLLLILGLASTSQQALAAQPLIIFSDQSQLISVARNPGTVVVGNPSIADVTIQGQQVFLHARTFGTTNVIILDENGAQLADFEVTVQDGGTNNVSLYKAGGLQTLVCAPTCEASLHVGDEIDTFQKVVAAEAKTKNNMALGQKDGEAPTPAQPAQ
jgi:Pilus formation protein N terminal region